MYITDLTHQQMIRREEENPNDWVERREPSHSKRRSLFADHSERTVRNIKRTKNIPSRKQKGTMEKNHPD